MPISYNCVCRMGFLLLIAAFVAAAAEIQGPAVATKPTFVAKPNALPPPRMRGAHIDEAKTSQKPDSSFPAKAAPSKLPDHLASFFSDVGTGACGAEGMLGAAAATGNQSWVDPHTSAAFAEMLNRVARGLQVSPAFTPLLTAPTAPATGKFWCTNNVLPQSCALVCNDGYWPNQETKLSFVAKNCIGPCGCLTSCTRLAPTAAVGNPPLTCSRYVHLTVFVLVMELQVVVSAACSRRRGSTLW